MTEAEKRERRALERKLSEMEEELKVSQTIDFLSFFYYVGRKMSLFFLSILFYPHYLHSFWHFFFILPTRQEKQFLFIFFK